MSRAFVKDAEDKADDLPDRPLSPHRNLVTKEGLAAIEVALGRFEATRTLPRPRKWKSVTGVRGAQVRK